MRSKHSGELPAVQQAWSPLPGPDRAPFMDLAYCASYPNPDLWTSDQVADRREAAELCHRCPVRAECAAYGAAEPFGVYGGTDRTTRRFSGSGRRGTGLPAGRPRGVREHAPRSRRPTANSDMPAAARHPFG